MTVVVGFPGPAGSHSDAAAAVLVPEAERSVALAELHLGRSTRRSARRSSSACSRSRARSPARSPRRTICSTTLRSRSCAKRRCTSATACSRRRDRRSSRSGWFARIPRRSTSAGSSSVRGRCNAWRPRRPRTPHARSPQRGDPAEAAIASHAAAEAYGLEVVAEDVSDRNAYTRFVAVARAHANRRRRRVAHGAVVRDGSPAGLALPGARAVRAARPESRAARLAPAARLAVALSLRRGARRARLRRGRLRGARRPSHRHAPPAALRLVPGRSPAS